VDGKEFFFDDTKMAMKNIPTNMVEKLKTYERKSDFSRVTGIDDGEEETVLDLTVKKGMKNGWFGNFDAGYGTEERYSENLLLNRFIDNNQFTISGTPTEEGQYKIVMRCTSTATYDGQGFSDTIRVNVNPPATGVVDLARQNGWVDMDGDFSKTLKLHFCVSEMQTADVQLFDMGGRLVYSESFGVDGEMTVGISGLNDLPSGIYMLSVRGKEGTWTKKVRRY
jgi:hypothetical protein